jgi:glycerate kinase
VIRPPEVTRWFDELSVAVDVQNPLLGPTGCSRIYGPQKGLKEFDLAERSLERLAQVMKRELHIDCASTPGSGAAGGLGYGLCAFAGGKLEPGFALFASLTALDEKLRGIDLVLTGEGSIDASTLMGKGVGELADHCLARKVPCIGLAGVVPDANQARRKFAATHALTPEFTTVEQAMREPAVWLERLAARAASEWRK